MLADTSPARRVPLNESLHGSRLLFLGSGAADWPPLTDGTPPADFTTYRRNAALLVDGHILIDGGPDICQTLDTFGLAAQKISDILFTHSHTDHFNAASVSRLAAYARPRPLRLWYPAGAQLGLTSFSGLELHSLHPGDVLELDEYHVLALAANHLVENSPELPLIYLFASATARWLYATDGAWFTVRTWYRLCDERPLDALIIDATLGDVSDDRRIFVHNSLAMVRQIAQVMRADGMLRPGARVILTHLAKETHLPHLELARQMAAEGLTVAFDGMELDVSGD